MEQKGFKQFLEDDPSLLEEYTYQEFMEKKSAAPANDDVAVVTAYAAFCQKRKKMEEA